MVPDFLFFKFICPAVVDPQRQGLINEDQEVPVHTVKNFVLVSKILNDVTHNATDKYEAPEFAPLKECVAKNYKILMEGVAALLV
jgi:hypothetical protein